MRQLESIAVGVSRNIEAINQLPDPDAFVLRRVTKFWGQPEVAAMSAAGLNSSMRLQRTVPFGASWFDPASE